MAENEVTKVRVTMRDDQTGQTATDYVDTAREGLLEAYVADARRRWSTVEVGEEPDAGPAGYDGATFVPFGTPHLLRDADGNVTGAEFHELGHELAGTFYPATDCVDCDHAPSHPLTGQRARTVQPKGKGA